jgi:AcrR family transcriptional regulator
MQWIDFDNPAEVTYRSVGLKARATVANGETRQDILHAALRRFAHSGYAATSVQQIVGDAKVSKPTLYYYFQDKAGLFQALVDEAHDARFRLMQAAAARHQDIREQLIAILQALFDYIGKNRELIRISLATAFAAPGEMPPGLMYADRCERNFELLHSLIREAQNQGRLDDQFESRELAFGFYGQANAYLMAHVVMPDLKLNHHTAVRIVDLFLSGAGPKA